MKINKTFHIQSIKNYENHNQKKENIGMPKNKNDRIEISDTLKEVNKCVKEIGIDTEKVEKIKEAINKGTYKISAEKLAEKLLEKINQDRKI